MPRRFKTKDVHDAETEACTFADLSLSPPLLRSLQEMGCERPSPVQLRSIPAALEGEDLIVQAKSGTGKTIAFCSIVLEGIDTAKLIVQAIILTPTREIAMQVTDEIQRLGWYMEPRVFAACFIGGVLEDDDKERLANEGQPHVAVCTPGRVLKLLRDRALKTNLRFMVLDEADKLLEPNFKYVVQEITEMAWSDSLQFVAVSATFPPPLVTEAENLFIHVERKRCKKLGQPPMRPLAKTVFLCTSAVKKDLDGKAQSGDTELDSAVLRGVLHLRYVVQGYHVRQKLPALLDILTTASYQQAFVFCNDAGSAVQIAEMLSQAGIPAAASSGRMEQSQRTQAFTGLKRLQYRVVVCTDLLARGVDVERVDVVVNLDLPAEKETYLHRSGRTARFGSVGWSVSLVFEGEEDEHLSYFQMQLGFDLEDYEKRDEAVAARLAELGADSCVLDPIPFVATPLIEPSSVPVPTASTSRPRKHRKDALRGDVLPTSAVGSQQVEEHIERGTPMGNLGIRELSQHPSIACNSGFQGYRNSVGNIHEHLSGGVSQAPFHQHTFGDVSHAAFVQNHNHGLSAHSLQHHPIAAAHLPGTSVSVGSGTNSLLSRFPPPPIFKDPLMRTDDLTPPAVQALLSEWQPWMLRCASFAEYSSQCPQSNPLGGTPGVLAAAALGGQSPFLVGANPFLHRQSAAERLEGLWAAHCQIWTATK